MKFNPKYSKNQFVVFNAITETGVKLVPGFICIVDADGVFEDGSQVYYDILGYVNGQEIVFKHNTESSIIYAEDLSRPFEFDTKFRNVYFTSDSHFFHKKIMEYCNRPFATPEEMNEAMIERWNSVVRPYDIVFHLGDFGFTGSKTKIEEVLSRLNGVKYLCIGNHDWKNLMPMRNMLKTYFTKIKQQYYIKADGQDIYLNHFPFLCYAGAWREPDRCAWQLFGHVHSSPTQPAEQQILNAIRLITESELTAEEKTPLVQKLASYLGTYKTGLDINRLRMLFPTQYDVGVDRNNFTPVSFAQVKNIITDQIMSLNLYRAGNNLENLIS